MRLDFAGERVLAIVAHPDDAELLCAGTLARAAADGAAIGIAVLCQGDKGQPARKVRGLASVRRREMSASAKLLDARLEFGGVPDGELADTPDLRRLTHQVIRAFGATLVIAHNPRDYHPDHRAAFALAEAATWFSASRGQAAKSAPLPTPPALWIADTVQMLEFHPGFYIDISEFMPLKSRMLACHRSQISRGSDGDFNPINEMMERQAAMRGAQAGVKAAEAFAIHPAWKRTRAW
jgi:LmbE family N-acetylglucosaminyl deacetylase